MSFLEPFVSLLHHSESNDQYCADEIMIIKDAFELRRARDLRSLVNKYISGLETWTALDFFLALERFTPLMFFHLLPRKGSRNRLRNGLQQSYGDHNRLLALAIDRLASGDLAWFEQRSTGPVANLRQCLQLYSKLNLSRSDQSLIWLAASLHDYGKLANREYGLDAEDGLFLVGRLLEALCDPAEQAIVAFGIRNHDLIEYVLNGETPVQFISQQMLALDGHSTGLAKSMLGIIQLAGAASLGEGRVTERKTEIFCDCLDGSILSDTSLEGRLTRLIRGERRRVTTTERDSAGELISSLPRRESTVLKQFLASVVLRGWSPALTIQDSVEKLLRLAQVWDHEQGGCEFLVIDKTHGKDIARLNLLNGTRVIVMQPE